MFGEQSTRHVTCMMSDGGECGDKVGHCTDCRYRGIIHGAYIRVRISEVEMDWEADQLKAHSQHRAR